LYQVDAQGPSEEKATFCGISRPVVKYVSQSYSRGGSRDAARGSQYCTSCYSAPVRGAEYCDERVCLSVSVCLSVRDHIFGTTRPIFANCFVHVSYGRGSVFLWRRSDTLCASGFINDVIFAHRPRLLEVAALLNEAQCTRSLGLGCKLCAVIPVAGQRTHGTTFRALKVTSQVATPGAECEVYDCLVSVVLCFFSLLLLLLYLPCFSSQCSSES